MTWLTEQEQKSENVWKISPVGCKTVFLAARCCGQYAIVFCSLPGELPGVQKPQIIMFLWTFSCGCLTRFESFINSLVCLHQAPSPCQWAVSAAWKSFTGARPHSTQHSPREHSPCGLAASEFWKPGWKKKIRLKGTQWQSHPNTVPTFRLDLASWGIIKWKWPYFPLRAPHTDTPNQVWFQNVVFPFRSVFLPFPPFWHHMTLSHSSGM